MMSLSFPLHVLAALLMGSMIGLERQWRQHNAGLRTNSLVAFGAALFVGLSTLFDQDASPSRIAAQIVSGLGFLGGGVILREGLNVRGLNTAATLWCSGAVGSLAGSGFPGEAFVGTCGVLFIHLGLRPVVRWIDSRTRNGMCDVDTYYRLIVECMLDQETRVRHVILRHVGSIPRMSLQGMAAEDTDHDRTVVQADIFALERNDRALEEIVARVGIEPEVKAVSWKRTEG